MLFGKGGEKMNVNGNVIISATSKKLAFLKEPNGKEEFKKVLENHELYSKNFLNENVNKECNEYQYLNNACDNSKLEEKIMNFVDLAIDALKQNTEKSSKELVGNDKSTEEVLQILQSLNLMIKSDYKVPATKDGKDELNSINLEQMSEEQLTGIAKLSPMAKKTLKNNLNEIVNLLENSKGNNEASPQMLDVVQQLITEVTEVKGDLSLLKVPSIKTVSLDNSVVAKFLGNLIGENKEKIKVSNEVNENTTVENTISKGLNNIDDNNKLKEKIINFVDVAIDALKQNTVKPSKELVGEEKLAPMEKSILKNNFSEIVTLLENSKGNNEISPQILDVLQKLTTEVSEVKGDLSLLKVLDEKPIVEGNLTENSNSTYDNNKLKGKIIDFVEVAIDVLKQNTVKSPKGSVGEEKLAPMVKNILKNNLSEIATLLENSKGNNETSPQILDVLQKLTTEVSDVKGDLSLLKVVDEKPTVEGNLTEDLNSTYDNNKLKGKIIDFVEVAIDVLKQNTVKSPKQSVGEDKSIEKVAQIQQVLKSLNLVFQSVDATKNEVNSINLEQLLGVKKLTPLAETLLKNNLSEIVNFNEKSKGNNGNLPKVLDVLQKLTTEVESLKEDSKSLKDNVITKQNIKDISGIVPINQLQSSDSTEQGDEFSKSRSSEKKFLDNLLGQDKEETKISKVVNFMSQFEAVKNVDTTKVQAPNITINKNNFEVDVIKTIKFMEINNIKDLIVKMNPKELGEITIKLTMESGIMKANISAQNKETYNLLNQNVQDISDRLKSMDIKIQSLDINVYEDSTFFSKDSSEKNNEGRQNNSSKTNKDLEEDIPITNNFSIEENQVNKFV